jgi:transposase
MTKTQVEVITSVQRRRRWSRVEKERIVAASMEAGAVASEVARVAGIHCSQLFRWRRQLCERAAAAPGFAAVTIADEAGRGRAPTLSAASGLIEVEFAGGARLRLSGSVDATAARGLVVASPRGQKGGRDGW